MAYLEKYYISYCDDFGTQRRVSILKKDFQGAENILLNTTDLSGAAWDNTQLEITGSRIVATNSNAPHWVEQDVVKASVNENYKAIIDVESAEYSRVYIRFTDGDNDSIITYYNILTSSFTDTVTETGFSNLVLNTATNGSTHQLTISFSSSKTTELSIVVGIVDDNNNYIFIGDNLNGNNLSGLNVNSILLEEGDGAIELLSDINPISISYESTEDFKFTPIRASLAEVFMIFGSGDGVDFEEFWTADEREFQVQDIKDGVIEWIGYVVPDGFQYEFKGGLYYSTIEATDGLSSLEDVIFIDDNQKPYGNQDLVYNNEFEFPFSLILTEILKKLELDLDLWVCVDSYEQTMLKVGDVREADPLSATYVNVKTYIKESENERIPYWYGSGEEWNCKEVLENALNIFGAKIYQEKNTWRIKSINSDIDYGTAGTQRYWRKYNTAGTYLFDYETIDDEVNIECDTITTLMVGNDHVMSMDDVYKAFRINYEYTFVRYGDTPINMLPNGNFCDFNNTSILAAPTGWERWRRDNKWYIRVKDITIPFDDAEGNTCGIEIGTHKDGIPTRDGSLRTDPNAAIWTSLKSTNFPYVDSGTMVILDVWNKYRYYSPNKSVTYAPIYRMILYTVTGKRFFLRNNIVNNTATYTWQQVDDDTVSGFNPIFNAVSQDNVTTNVKDTYFFSLEGYRSEEKRDGLESYSWRHFHHELQDTPEAGFLEIHIHGLAASSGRNSDSFPAFKTYLGSSGSVSNFWRVVRENWIDQGGDIPRLQITGLSLGKIPNESELPESYDYIYNNENENQSLQVDPITIFNGDLQDENHISNLIVPTNTGGGKNFWDDLSDAYGTSSLGLLTAREIMRQYQTPCRILEGTIKIQDARFGSVYTFDVIPNVRFILQRGTMNKQKQHIEDATFTQINELSLLDGGREGGNTLEPEWISTGNVYCKINENTSLNTGYVVIEEEDVNPNSETYQETKEVVSTSQDLTQCPLNQPRLYYWGTDDIYLNTGALAFSPFIEVSSNEIEVDLFNDEGNYIYFLHLKSLGSIERIYTKTSPNNVISDWVYLEDRIIDGYIYRVLRTDYVMTNFINFTHNFKFA